MNKPVFRVVSGGLFTTIQDDGRFGYLQYGIPACGAMDYYSFQIANLLVGNQEHSAALEVTMKGPTLEVLMDTVVAICGADLTPLRNGQPLPLWKPNAVVQGDILSFKERKSGVRAYFAVAGGLEGDTVLGSKSTYVRGGFGGLKGRKVEKGDVIVSKVSTFIKTPKLFPHPEIISSYSKEMKLRVILGPDQEMFTDVGLQTFLQSTYEISPQSDRMGYRTTGPIVEHVRGADILSEAVVFGTVQIPANGLPIIMAADRQTTGGYPRIATIASVDFKKLAQLMPGDRIMFQPVSVQKAQELYRKERQLLSKLKAAIHYRYSCI